MEFAHLLCQTYEPLSRSASATVSLSQVCGHTWDLNWVLGQLPGRRVATWVGISGCHTLCILFSRRVKTGPKQVHFESHFFYCSGIGCTPCLPQRWSAPTNHLGEQVHPDSAGCPRSPGGLGVGPAQVGVPLTGSPLTLAPSVAVLSHVQLPSVQKPCPDTNKKKWGLTVSAAIRFVWGQLGSFLRDSNVFKS